MKSKTLDKFTHCVLCKEKIPKGAIKCAHCGSFQNWRRHLGFSSSFLSLMVAFISVLTVLITILSNLSKANDSDIKVSIINWQRVPFNDQGRLSQVLILEAFVTNAGQRPGALKNFSIKGSGENRFQYMRSGQPEVGNAYSPKEVKAQIVEPGKTLLIKEHIKTLWDIKTFEEKFTNSDLRIEVVNFSGKIQEIILKIRNSPPRFFGS